MRSEGTRRNSNVLESETGNRRSIITTKGVRKNDLFRIGFLFWATDSKSQ
ncbi:hypothetical protein C943_00644 [Mariniradius saccharolyticus AK6]|uniref:Uncharacterized protein n=1 Tax=Mariniradius saccharolyticus AK6 TaxID=1239962 RepID=M7Y877_9BACT|nr:hypothetical protein C943_00644 [Mariniradius saccharolyticus AK6]